jgi:hypothetical protein
MVVPRRAALSMVLGAAAADAQQPALRRTDIDDLLRHAALPARPETATWRVRTPGTASPRVPGPTDTMVEAVLSYGANDAATLAGRTFRPERWREVATEFWWPQEVQAYAVQFRLRLRLLPADDLVQPPYSDATLGHVPGTGLFLLWLTTR